MRLRKEETKLPVVYRSADDADEGNDFSSRLWTRINAFLMMRSPKTQETYKGIVKEWCKFLGSSAGSTQSAKLIQSATDLHAQGYRVWLEKRPGERPRTRSSDLSTSKVLSNTRVTRRQKKDGLESTQSNATIAKKFAALRRIYRMLISADFDIRLNPFDTDRVPVPSKEAGRKRPTEMLEFALVKKFVNTPDETSERGLRDRAILAALFGGALRRSEVCSLRLADLKVTKSGTNYLYLRSTKAKKDAQQALPSWAAAIIRKWYEKRLQQNAAPGDSLFISYTGKGGTIPCSAPVTGSGVYKLFRAYARKAGLEAFITPHSARATAITKLLSDGIPHREVQEFSRHASVQMVEAYDKRRISVDENPARKLDFE